MARKESTAPLRAEFPDVEALAQAAARCQACPLHARATQVVFGRGSERPRLVLVGEQPGDEEDKQGRPFVGPAGQELERLLGEAGLEMKDVYLTNIVKHFKWTESGKRRLHAKPNRMEVKACQPWFEAEIALLQPKAIVGLGATACQAILGTQVRVTEDRGTVIDWGNYPVMVTWHPSAILRAGEGGVAEKIRAELVADLITAGKLAGD